MPAQHNSISRFAVTKADGDLHLASPAAYRAFVRTLTDGAYTLILEPFKRQRSIQANKRYWALVTLGAASLGYDEPEELHEALAFKLLRLPDDERTGSPRRMSTAKLDTQAFSAYCDSVERVLIEYGADLTGWEQLAEAA